MRKIALLPIVALAGVAIMAVAVSGCSGCGRVENEGQMTVDTLSGEVVPDSDEVKELQIINLRITSEPVLDKKSRTYSFNVSAQLTQASDRSISYALRQKGVPETVIATSEDGGFTGIEGLEDDGVFIVTASLPGVSTVEPREIEITGCPKISKVKKLTVDEMQAMVNDLVAGSTENPLLTTNEQFVPDYQLVFSNLSQDENKPAGWGDVQSKLIMQMWEGLTVKSIDYDEFDRVNKVVLEIKR